MPFEQTQKNNSNKQVKSKKDFTKKKNNYSGLYLDTLKFSDLKDLTQITNPFQHTKMPLYLLFNPDFIKKYDKASKEVQTSFEHLVLNQVKFCRDTNETGIKSIAKCKVSIQLNINNIFYHVPITHELKVVNHPHRIGLFPLQPSIGQSPTILIAALYVEDGFKNEKNKKLLHITFKGKDLTIPLSVNNSSKNNSDTHIVSQSLQQQGLFSQKRKDAIQNTKSIETRPTMNRITTKSFSFK